jgi:nucleoside-diphosphate kinase
MQKTLILFKPDAIERGLVGAIMARFERAGLRVEQAELTRPPLAKLEEHYADLKAHNPAVFQRTTGYLAGKPFLAMILIGPNAIAKVRQLLGATDPRTAPPGSIRGDFGCDTIADADAENRATMNLIHAADSEASVQHEARLWFKSW